MGDGRPHILVVDDDGEVRSLVARYLGSQGFRVTGAPDGSGLRAVIGEDQVDLVLLDLGLPGENGLSLTRFLHDRWGGPVIIVSGQGDTVDRVVGLEMGADDYLGKPFDLRELLARVRSVLRRARTGKPNHVAMREELEFGGFRLDLASRELHCPEGNRVEITTGEFDLLRVFLEKPNRVLSRDQLLQYTRGRDAAPYDRAIDVQIGRLRSKLRKAKPHCEFIKTVRGAGYVFAAPIRSR